LKTFQIVLPVILDVQNVLQLNYVKHVLINII